VTTKKYLIFFTLIIALAAFLRFWQLGQIPLSLYWDEIAMFADAKKVAQTGNDLHDLSPFHLIFPSYGDYKLAPYIWSATSSFALFGHNYFALRAPSAFAGIFTIIIAGLIAFSLCPLPSHKKTYQLLTMIIIAFSPWSILFSRTGFEGHLAQMFLSLAVLFLIYSWQKKPSLPYSFASGFFGGLAFWTYFSVRFVWPPIFLAFTLYFYLRTKKLSQALTSLTAIGIIFFIMYLTMTFTPFYQESNRFRLGTDSILNQTDLPHQINAQRQISGNNLLSRLIFTQKGAQLSQLLNNYAAHLDFSYLFLTGDANLRHSSGSHGLFYLICAPLLILGFIGLFHRDRSLLFVLIIWWLAALLPASVPTTGVPHALRTLNALTPIALIISFSFFPLLQLSKRSRKIYFSLISLIFCFSFIRFSWYYFTIYPTLSAPDWQASNPKLAQILIDQKDNFPHVYTTHLDDRLFLWYLAHPDTDLAQLNQKNQSHNFQFTSIDNVHFNTLPSLDTSPFFLLGPKNIILQYLQEKEPPYQILYDYQEYGQEYLGVVL